MRPARPPQLPCAFCTSPLCLLLLPPLCPPQRDIDLLKVKLMEEVEAPYNAKCDNLAKVRRRQGGAWQDRRARAHVSLAGPGRGQGKAGLHWLMGCSLHCSRSANDLVRLLMSASVRRMVE